MWYVVFSNVTLRLWLLTVIHKEGLLYSSTSLCPSLPTMLKSPTDVLWPVLVWWSYMSDGALKCSLNPSQKILAESPMYSSSQITLWHLYQYITPIFCLMLSLSFGVVRIFCHFWNVFVYCVYCICPSCFHIILWYKEWLCGPCSYWVVC